MRRAAGRARLIALTTAIAAASGPFACGGDAFTAASTDGGSTLDGSIEGATGDAMVGDGGGGGADAAPPPAEAGGVNVTGTVVDTYLLPMAGVAVQCQGESATTASDGTFTLTGITTPYDVTAVVTEAGGHKHAYVFEGATRKSPTLQLAAEQGEATETSGVSGALGDHAVNTAGIVFADFPAATPATTSPTIAIGIGSATYSGSFSWVGGASAATTLYALQWNSLNGVPTSYTAFSTSQQQLSAGGVAVWTPASATTVGQGEMIVTVTPSPGYFPVDIGVYLRPTSGSLVAAPIQHGVRGGTTTTTVVTPNIGGATFVACGLQVANGFDGGANAAFGYTCNAGLDKSATPTLQPPPPTAFISPPSTATIGTVFSYAAIPSGLYFVAFKPATSTSGPSDALFIITSSTQVTLPDPTALGLSLPAGMAATAEAYGVAPFLGIDAALTAAGYAERLNDYRLNTAPLTNGSVAYSGVATFQVQ